MRWAAVACVALLVGCGDRSFVFQITIDRELRPTDVIIVDGDPNFSTASWTFDSYEAAAGFAIPVEVSFGSGSTASEITTGYCYDHAERHLGGLELGELRHEIVTLGANGAMTLSALAGDCRDLQGRGFVWSW